VDRAAQQALDDAVIVRRGEELHFGNAGCGLERLGNAFRATQLVGFVLAAIEPDAQGGDVLGEGRSGHGEGHGGQQDFTHCGHGWFPWVTRMLAAGYPAAERGYEAELALVELTSGAATGAMAVEVMASEKASLSPSAP